MPSTANPSAAASDEWPGKGLGLPADGPRSVGRFGRRLLGLIIDWVVASLVSILAGLYGVAHNFTTLGVFALLQIVFIAVLSGSIGHLVVGLRVVPVRPGPIGVLRPVIRTLLLCIAVPPLIHDKEGRGLHDRAAGTVIVRR